MFLILVFNVKLAGGHRHTNVLLVRKERNGSAMPGQLICNTIACNGPVTRDPYQVNFRAISCRDLRQFDMVLEFVLVEIIDLIAA